MRRVQNSSMLNSGRDNTEQVGKLVLEASTILKHRQEAAKSIARLASQMKQLSMHLQSAAV